MIQTSNFAKYNHMSHEQRCRCVSVAIDAPWWYKGWECKELAPPTHLLDWWKRCGQTSKEQHRYKTIYYRQVLAKIDPKSIIRVYGEHTIMLCWEAKGKFCHRRIIGDWLGYKLGIEVNEL